MEEIFQQIQATLAPKAVAKFILCLNYKRLSNYNKSLFPENLLENLRVKNSKMQDLFNEQDLQHIERTFKEIISPQEPRVEVSLPTLRPSQSIPAADYQQIMRQEVFQQERPAYKLPMIGLNELQQLQPELLKSIEDKYSSSKESDKKM